VNDYTGFAGKPIKQPTSRVILEKSQDIGFPLVEVMTILVELAMLDVYEALRLRV